MCRAAGRAQRLQARREHSHLPWPTTKAPVTLEEAQVSPGLAWPCGPQEASHPLSRRLDGGPGSPGVTFPCPQGGAVFTPDGCSVMAPGSPEQGMGDLVQVKPSLWAWLADRSLHVNLAVGPHAPPSSSCSELCGFCSHGQAPAAADDRLCSVGELPADARGRRESDDAFISLTWT